MDPVATTSATKTNGESTLRDLFALTDEQILEIEPGATESATVGQPFLAVQAQAAETSRTKPSPESPPEMTPESTSQSMRQNAQARMPVPLEPPAWLAAQMKDPWSGEEARDLWNGVQQARTEAAAYREVFAKPEDARALKEIYPGGVSEARTAAARARQFDEIDRAYFGAAGTSPEQSSAARAQLAAMMLREDPVAFREMVQAGLRALEQANVAPPFRAASTGPAQSQDAGLPAGPGQVPPSATQTTAPESALVASYAAFEKAANEELERSVGGAIARTLEQALPSAGRTDGEAMKGRLAATIRQEIEKRLQGDRQLGEQVAQILSARRLDDAARAQVVRLIGERAQQLLPGAAKGVLNQWTQTTLGAHRAKTQRAASAGERADIVPAQSSGEIPPLRSGNNSRTSGRNDDSMGRAPRIDYRKLSDEQILEM